MIFRKNSSADELFQGMQETEKGTFAEEQVTKEASLISGLQALADSAEYFDKAGLAKHSVSITNLMVILANVDIDDAKHKPTSSEKEMFRYFGFKTKDLENVDDTDDEDCNIELGKNEK